MTNDLHICLFENNYPNKNGSGGGGAGCYLKTISKEHIKQGHKVTLVKRTLNHYKSNYIDDIAVRVIHIHFSSKFLTYLSKVPIVNILTRSLSYIYQGWGGYKEILKLNKKYHFDILEFTEGGNFWIGFFKKFKYISHLHCSHYTIYKQCGLKPPLGYYIERLVSFIAMNRAHAILSPSKAMISIVENEKNGRFKNKYVIPLAVQKNIYLIKKKKNQSVKFIFASRNDPFKGGDTLLKAITIVNTKLYEKVNFKFFGYELTNNTTIPSNIILNDFLPHDDLLKEYNLCDVAILPSFFDNSPLFIYEAMTAGLPVIASKVGGIPELIKHGHNGYLFEKNNHQMLATQIIELINNTKKRGIMGKNAKKFIFDYANVEKIAKKKLSLYKHIINSI